MKKLLLFMLFPLLSIGQTQIGTDIDGEAAGDSSGNSVSLSGDGTTLAIGAPNNSGNGAQSGSVRVYKNISGIWTKVGVDIDGEAAGDTSGVCVSLSSDGYTLAIGASQNSGNGSQSGSVRVYKNVSGNWVKVGADIDGEASGDWSGDSIFLSSDGSMLAIGATGNDAKGNETGSVRVYKNVSGTWTKVGADIDGEAQGDYSGGSVSLSNDGSVLAIGASYNSGSFSYSGSVRVYKNVSSTWTKVGADIDGEGQGDFSGTSISLSSDGSILAIGAPINNGNGSQSGSVRVYRNVSGTWTKVGADIDGEAANDWSGYGVSLSSDGSILAIGAVNNDGSGTNAGSVRVYKNVTETWTKIGVDIDGETAGENSGRSVSLSSDGNTLAIGAPLNDGNGADSGSVRVYDLSSSTLNSDSFTKANFLIYPNPVTTILNLQIEKDVVIDKIIITDLTGKIILQKSQNTPQVNVQNLAKGMYFVQVFLGDKQWVSKFLKE
jgi:Flp pilus assembly pilin Flp